MRFSSIVATTASHVVGEVEAGGPHDRVAGALDGADPVDPERAHPVGGVGDEVPDAVLLDEAERVDDALGLAARAVGVAEAHLDAVDHGAAAASSRCGGRGDGRAAPAGRVEHDGRRRRLGVGAERLGQRLDELAQRRLGLRRRRRRRPGDHEQRAGLGGGEPAEVGAGAAEQLPPAALAGLGVDGDAGDRQRLEVAAGRLDRHLQLVGQLGGRDPAPRLQHEEGGHEAIGAHASTISPEVVTR